MKTIQRGLFPAGVLAASSLAQGALLEFTFIGTVTFVSPMFPITTVGSPFTMSYTVDSDVPPFAPEFADFVNPFQAGGTSYQALSPASWTISGDTTPAIDQIVTVVNANPGGTDRYVTTLFNGFFYAVIDLFDAQGTAFSSEALPESLSLTPFMNGTGDVRRIGFYAPNPNLLLSESDRGTAPGYFPAVTGRIDAINIVVVPSPCAAMLAAVCGFAAWRRRGC